MIHLFCLIFKTIKLIGELKMVNSVKAGGIYPSSEAPAQTMVQDALVSCVGKELSFPDFAALALVCRAWKEMIQPNIEKKALEEVLFGTDKWLSLPGVWSVSEEPALTEDQKNAIIAKLKSPCEFFNDKDSVQPHRFQNDKIKRVWQTQKCIFFTKTINGEPRTINSQDRLFHFIKKVYNGSAFSLIVGGKKEDAFRNQPAPKSYWGWVTLDLVPGSRGIIHNEKGRLLTDKGYRVLTLNEAVTSNLILNLGPSKEKQGYFFGRERPYWTYTATTKFYYNVRLIVGAADPSGPEVLAATTAPCNSVGLAGIADLP